jgi:hypothetical protein
LSNCYLCFSYFLFYSEHAIGFTSELATELLNLYNLLVFKTRFLF